MKKSYIAPQINVVTVKTTIMNGSNPSIGIGGQGNAGDVVGSRYNTVDFYDDDDEM